MNHRTEHVYHCTSFAPPALGELHSWYVGEVENGQGLVDHLHQQALQKFVRVP
jgi:hypothetical protein